VHVNIPITFIFEDGDPPVPSWSISVRYDPGVIEDAIINPVREADYFNRPNPAYFEEEGVIGAAVVYVFKGPEEGRVVTSTEVVANISLCVRDAAPPGVYPIEILPEARRTQGAPVLSSVYTAQNETHVPELQGGSITIQGDPVSEECTREPPPPPPPEPPELPPHPWTASYTLADVTALRGGEFTLPFELRGSAEIRGFSFSIDFDESLLVATEMEDLIVKEDGSSADFRVFEFNNNDAIPGASGIEEGFFVGAVVLSLDDPYDC
jgi:hypothetical protein